MTVFTKFVELGRVVHIPRGKAAGKLAAIVDVIDANRLLVHGPEVPPQEAKVRNCVLTRLKLKMPHRLGTKHFLKLWKDSLIEKRFDQLNYAKRLKMLERRKNLTDFEYSRVRAATRTCNKMINGAYAQLRAKNPRLLSKLQDNRKHNMAVKLGYKKVMRRTPEQKARSDARKIVLRQNRIVKKKQLYYQKKELRAAKREKRQARNEKLAKEGKLKERKFVPKEERKHAPKGKNVPLRMRVSTVKQMRRQRDTARKEAKEKNRLADKTYKEYKEACRKASSDKTAPPTKPKIVRVAKTRGPSKTKPSARNVEKKKQAANKKKAA